MKKLLILLLLIPTIAQADIIIRGNKIRFISGQEIRAEDGKLKFYDSFASTRTLTSLSTDSLVAEEIEEYLPEAVIYDEKGELKVPTWNKLIISLLKEIKKLKDKVKILEEKDK